MIRRDASRADVLSHLGSELQFYRRHAEGQTREIQRSQAELRHNLGRSNAEGAQLRILHEETRTANTSVEPEVTRLQGREVQLSTRVSTRRNHETELTELLLNLQ